MLVTTRVDAFNSARSETLKSQGVVRFNDSEGNSVEINSNDLYQIADEIDTLESEVKTGISDSLHIIGSSEATPSMQFNGLFNLIEHSQDCNSHGVVSRNLPIGKTAWVEGNYITGTGEDLEAEYQRGYADGRASVANGEISYTYHVHTGSSSTGGGCYSNTPTYHRHTNSCYGPSCGEHMLDAGYTNASWGCGAGVHLGECPVHGVFENRVTGEVCGYRELTCTIPEGTFEGYKQTCGKTTSTIESATITFP